MASSSVLRIPGTFIMQGATLYGDWFPSTGSNTVHRAQLVYDAMGDAGDKITVDLLTKAKDEQSGQATVVASVFFDQNDPVYTIKEDIAYDDSVKELVRYRLVAKSGSIGSVRMLTPIFFESAKP